MLKQSQLTIDFLIIGGGLAGLSCAVALRRVGHRVVLLERDPSINTHKSEGCRMPPNLSKILYHWGLQDELQKIALKLDAIDLLIFETGEVLGTHIWNEEMLRETRGELIFTHYNDLRQLLLKVAVSLGAKIRFNSRVTSIDPEARKVMLASGDVLTADVIIGADGVNGLARTFLVEDETPPPRQSVYCATIPRSLIMEDEELRYIYGSNFNSMYSWFGNSRAVLGFPIGGKADFSLFVYGTTDGKQRGWENEVPLKAMQQIMEPCESRLRKLVRLAKPPVCLPLIDHPKLDNWVDDSGRMLVIGEAAHPLPPGSIQQCAMSVEDGAVLARLFLHLRSHDQISNFLYAFQDLREPRCSASIQKELADIFFMTLPPGEMQKGRDAMMRARRDAGVDVLSATSDQEETPEWTEMKDIFGYDAEDEADNWWVEWGLLRERAMGLSLTTEVFNNMAVQHNVDMSLNEIEVS